MKGIKRFMKKTVVKIMQTFNKIYNWLKQKDRLGNQHSATILMVAFFASGIIIYFCNNPKVIKIICYSFMILLFGMISIFRFDVSDKIISKITRDKCSTPREILKNMSHISYVYGLFWFSLESCLFIEIFLVLFTGLVFDETRVGGVTELWIISMFIYTFFYFAYHIYFANSKDKIEKVKQRLQLYAAVGTTVSFIMLLFGESRELKIFVVGTMLEYTWLQYFITKELNEAKEDLVMK